MKNKTLIIIGIIIALIIGVVILFVSKRRKKENDFSLDNSLIAPNSTTNNNTLQNASFPLKLNSKGKEVARLQTWLNKGYLKSTPIFTMGLTYPNLIVDGILGNKTKSALEDAGYKLPLDYMFFLTHNIA